MSLNGKGGYLLRPLEAIDERMKGTWKEYESTSTFGLLYC